MDALTLPAAPTGRAHAIGDRGWLAVALLVGLALRVGALIDAGIEHPDEIFQYLEQTHRLLFGDGVVTWEYRAGMRGGLLPLLLAPPMWLGHLIAPEAPLWAGPRLMFTMISLLIICAGWGIGRRISPAHGAFAALALAVAPDLVHFAPHTLSEPIAIALLLVGMMLAGETRLLAVALGGALLAFGACIRFHYAPAALILAWPALRPPSRSALLGGAALGLLVSAAADLVSGVTPFAWIGANIDANLLAGRSAAYGIKPARLYADAMRDLWAGWAIPVVALALVGAWRRWPIAAAALLTIGSHMLIGHKEYRFILLASALVTLLAGLGTADIVRRAERWNVMAAALWLVAGASIFASGRAAALSPAPTPGQSFLAALRSDPSACGVALWRIHWSGTTGYVGLHRPLPIMIVDDRAQPEAAGRAFNRLIAPENIPVVGFTNRVCDGHGACLLSRPGVCALAAEATPINDWLREHDQ